MRLLRPPDAIRHTSAPSPTSAQAISRAASNLASTNGVSPATTKDLRFDILPSRAHHVRRLRFGCAALGEQDPGHSHRESGIDQNLLEIIDEAGAAERGNTRELVMSRILEEDL